jgi:hypothetical protein
MMGSHPNVPSVNIDKDEGPSHALWHVLKQGIASGSSKWLLVVALYALCAGTTFISYHPYLFRWDDAEYLARSIVVTSAFWHCDVFGVVNGMVSIRPPVMTLLGLPWGSLASWNSAGDCFVTLAAVISLLVACCLYLLMRIGVKPTLLVAASICVAASIGPYPPDARAHAAATAFTADSLFAWTALAGVLLIPYETRNPCATIRSSFFRGILWGMILSLGTMTKFSFLYFAVIILPVLFFLRLRNDGARSARVALLAFVCCSGPSALYLLLFGRRIFENAKASSFGAVSRFYYVPLPQFLGDAVRESPGLILSFLLTVSALIYVGAKRRLMKSLLDLLPLLIIVGFGIIVLAAPNRQIRYAFPTIVALPFLVAVVMSGKRHSVPRASAALACGVVACGLLAAAAPTRHRPDRQSLSRSEVILAVADRCHAKRILLATDSPTLNADLIRLAREVSTSGVSTSRTLAYQVVRGIPVEEDFRIISEYDLVVFQDRLALNPPFTNLRVSEYERYVQQAGFVSLRVADDTSVYLMPQSKSICMQ